MRRILVAVTAAAAMVVGPATAVAAATPASGHAGLDGLEGLEGLDGLDGLVAAGAVGAVAEIRDGDRVWRGVSGVAAIGSTRPVPVASRFRAGSLTKTFVATVVLQLVDEGRLRLDDSVAVGGHRVTVRRLLDHTSGIPDYRPTLVLPPAPEFLDQRWRTWTPEELIARVAGGGPAEFAYSNTNYLVLGQVIEAVTGRSYADEVERRIIRPLRLTRTRMPGTDPRIRGPHPHGYVPIQRGDRLRLVDFTEWNPSVMGAGGELISTTRDLNRFFAALFGGRLLPRRLLREMRTPGVADGRYGLGLAWRDTPCGTRVYGNDGDAIAYQSWSFSTLDGLRQVTLALTPDFSADLDDAVDAYLDRFFCR
ncbi:serine hydrolase [Asanoa sp. WMMD1127]|uniref:serine hydrolase domain-containing protein n=1 Tax=Asanoa sp. WMMD1127 TaxID=3016107 RepID=UPI0024168BBB|nr:serine hydrolase domain-containing protein [Asanoa sp. WMMD1127]MDG4826946.1 serine hydrolase [Asanoa sp. WMMD1127]